MNRMRRLIALAFIVTLVLLGIAAWTWQTWWPELKHFLTKYGSQFEGLEALIAIAVVLLGWFVWLVKQWLNSNPPPPDKPSLPPTAPLVDMDDVKAGGNINVATGESQIGGARAEIGSTIYGDQVGGDKTVYEAPPQGVKALHNIPAPPADFTGRENELNELLKQMKSGGVTISGLTGMGGIGKTALAFVLAHRLRANYPDAQLFLDMRGTRGPARTPAEALTTIIRAFHPIEQLPEDVDVLQGLYLTVLDGKRALILLDDAKDNAQVERLFPPPTCALVITSRQHFTLPGLHPLRLDRLPPNDAVKLLRKIAPRITEAEAAQLASLFDYLPLALRVAGSTLAELPDISPADYLRWLEDDQRRLEPVEASFTYSYNLLDETLQQRWRMLAVFPATFDRLAVAAVWGLDPETELDEAAETVSTLVRYSLVEWLEAKQRYRLHDLARLFTNARLAADERDTAQHSHASYFQKILEKADDLYLQGGQGVLQGLALFDAEWPNIQAGQIWAASHAEHDDTAAWLCSHYPNEGIYVLALRQHSREQIEWLEAALAAARHLKDRSGEGVALCNLGLAYADLGEVRQAIGYYQQHLTIAHEIGDRRGEGAALANLGNAYGLLGAVRQAIGYYQQQLTIARATSDQRGEGNALANLGLAYFQLNAVRQAIVYFQQHLVIARKLGDRDGEGTILGYIANAYLLQGEVRQAIDRHQQALTIAREIGNRRGEGSALGNLGLAYAELGEVQQAIDCYQQSLAIARETGNRRSEGNALFNMSLARYKLGERQQAIPLAEAALHIFEQIEDPNAEKVRRKLAAWRGEQPPS